MTTDPIVSNMTAMIAGDNQRINKKPQLHPGWIDPDALEIVRRLQRAGHKSYLVGGCVRDLLLAKQPKDFDIATTALPQQVKRILPYSYIIGRRFRLVLAKRGDKQFEIATFRRNITVEDLPGEKEEVEEEAPLLGDNFFGTPEEDAKRRDFTINGLFYDPVSDELIDYIDGLSDLKNGTVRMIGDPTLRLIEDPIRILRGIRLAHMIRFSLDPALRASMMQQAEALPMTALPRRREEFLKILKLEDPVNAWTELYDLGVLNYVLPHWAQVFEGENASEVLQYMHSYYASSQGGGNPLSTFLGIVLPYMRVHLNLDPMVPNRAQDLGDHEELLPLMRDELGMFKLEQNLLTRGFQMVPTLAKRDLHEKKGERRRQVVLQNEAFSIGLKICEADHALNPQAFRSWQAEFDLLCKSENFRPRTTRRTRNRGFRARHRNKKGSQSETQISLQDSPVKE